MLGQELEIAIAEATSLVGPKKGPGTTERRNAPYVGEMLSGAHIVLFSTDPEVDRSFFRNVLGFDSVDAGNGWLVFALPPAEAAFHPAEVPGAELYLTCDDIGAEVASLRDRGVTCSAVEDARWGLVTKIRLPSGSEIGLYQPKHPKAIDLS
jgi:catechol 2,3-dioxygenase-like lactoylglutathione lyase family enzyme